MVNKGAQFLQCANMAEFCNMPLRPQRGHNANYFFCWCTLYRSIKGHKMWPKILCYTPSISYSCSCTENPLTLGLCFGLTGNSQMRIQACDDGLLPISEGILPRLIKTGHNFLSPEKLVKKVWLDVRNTGNSEESTGRVFYYLVSIYPPLIISGTSIILVFSTTNHLYASIYRFDSLRYQIPAWVQKPGVLHMHITGEDIVLYYQGPYNKRHNSFVDRSLLFLFAMGVDQLLCAFYFSIYGLVAKKLIPLYEFLYEFLLGGV